MSHLCAFGTLHLVCAVSNLFYLFRKHLLTQLQSLASIGPPLGFRLLASASTCMLQHVLIISVDTSSVPTPLQLIRQRFVLIFSAIPLLRLKHYDFFLIRGTFTCTIYSIPQKCLLSRSFRRYDIDRTSGYIFFFDFLFFLSFFFFHYPGQHG